MGEKSNGDTSHKRSLRICGFSFCYSLAELGTSSVEYGIQDKADETRHECWEK